MSLFYFRDKRSLYVWKFRIASPVPPLMIKKTYRNGLN
jgi:hypothetical protein